MAEARFERIEGAIGDLAAGQQRLEVRMDRLETRMDKLEVGQESIADQVRLIAEGHAALLAHFDRRFDHLEETVISRVEVLEKAYRADHR